MLIFRKGAALHHHILNLKSQGLTLAFVPTMGALHNGHLQLISTAKEECDVVIASIFVNPTQFNNAEDLAKYPKTEGQDITMLEAAACDALYLPTVMDIYPNGTVVDKDYSFHGVDQVMEGAFRPGHFLGVAQVVDRLLDIVPADTLLLGEKDLQQVAIITLMASEYHPTVKIRSVPTIRESDGLAMSSRNRRLSSVARKLAPMIYQSLGYIRDHISHRPYLELKQEVLQRLDDAGYVTDYLEMLEIARFSLVSEYNPEEKTYLLIATTIGGIRLIDNLAIN